MSGTIDRELKKALVRDCINEILQIQNPKPEDKKLFEDVIKKYENKIYERTIGRIPVNTLEDKKIKEDFMHPGNRPSFPGDPNHVQPGAYNPMNPPQNQNDMGGFLGMFGLGNANKNFGDPHANSKYFYPEDQKPYYQHLLQPYPNKPMSSPLKDKTGFADPFEYTGPVFNDPPLVNNILKMFTGQSQPGYPPQPGLQPQPVFQPQPVYQPQPMHQPQPMFQPQPMYQPQPQPTFQPQPMFQPQPGFQPQPQPQQGFPQGGGFPLNFGGQQPAPANPLFHEDDQMILKRNIAQLGGIERTIPNMEKSLRNYELRQIDLTMKSPNRFETPAPNLNPNPNPNPYPYTNPNPMSNNPLGNLFGGLLEGTGVKGASPARGMTPVANRNYMTPDRNDYPGDVDPRYGSLFDQKKEYKSSFNSSKKLRQEKAALLNVKFDLPETNEE